MIRKWAYDANKFKTDIRSVPSWDPFGPMRPNTAMRMGGVIMDGGEDVRRLSTFQYIF